MSERSGGFTVAELEYLGGQRLGRVATVSAAGVPDVAAVTFTLTAAGEIEIRGLDNPRTLKWRNVVATGRAAFVVDDLESVQPWKPRGVKVHGTAIADESDGQHVLRITPTRVWSWNLNEGAETHFGGIVERRDVTK